MSEVRLVSRATGLLAEFNVAGVLEPADVHVAQRLGRLGGEADERVLLAVALTVRALRAGSVVLRLREVQESVDVTAFDDTAPRPSAVEPAWPEVGAWQQAVAASPLVTGTAAPLRAHDDGLWLTRSWQQETRVAQQLLRRRHATVPVSTAALAAALSRLFPGELPDEQRRAAAVCAASGVSVLGGGPGTGKTTTVARLLVALRDAEASGRRAVEPGSGSGAVPGLRVALAAPTGKAAARLQEAVHGAELPEDRAWLQTLTASTLHRLLGLRRRGNGARHDASSPLPYDVVVVDEASMLSLALFDRLLDALAPTTRLVLAGDPDQLAAVEAGAVLGDIVAASGAHATGPEPVGPADGEGAAADLAVVVPYDPARLPGDRAGVALLRRVHRFAGQIEQLAQALRDGDSDAALQVLSGGDQVELLTVADGAAIPQHVQEQVRVSVLRGYQKLFGADAKTALGAIDEHRLLCAHRSGPRGVAAWSLLVQRWVEQHGVAVQRDGRYAGLPLMVTANTYDEGLFNGDTGVVVAGPLPDSPLQAAFETASGIRTLALGRLGDVAPMHAMTVHRAQGSQFEHVTVVLPEAGSPLATRETLYTAVTRAQRRVTLIGSPEAVNACVTRRSARATGLRERLS